MKYPADPVNRDLQQAAGHSGVDEKGSLISASV